MYLSMLRSGIQDKNDGGNDRQFLESIGGE